MNCNNIFYCPALEEEIEIKVISMDEKNFIIKIKKNATIKEFKEKLETVSNVPSDKQRLIYRGKLLNNNEKISYYEISNLDAVHLIANLLNDNNEANISNTNLNNNLSNVFRVSNDPNVNHNNINSRENIII